jgi:hypothetical protein
MLSMTNYSFKKLFRLNPIRPISPELKKSMGYERRRAYC